MDQNNNNYQDLNNVPNNTYAEDYQAYIVAPGYRNEIVPTPKKVASRILCAISNMIMLSFCVIWIVLCYMNLSFIASNKWGSLGYAGMMLVYLLPGMLVPSIIAKIINRKSKWAVSNFIAIVVILVIISIASLLMPTLLKDVKIKTLNDPWTRSVDHALEEYEFDVVDIGGDYSHVEDDAFEVWIYVSTEADDDQIEEIDDFLMELRDMDDNDIYKMPIEVHPCYFDPDEDSNIVYAKSYEFDNDSPNNKIKIEKYLKEDLKDKEGEPDSVPEELEEGHLLIVVR